MALNVLRVREGKAGRKSKRKDCGKIEEGGEDFSSIDTYKTKIILEEN
jgi:hypothetical protein